MSAPEKNDGEREDGRLDELTEGIRALREDERRAHQGNTVERPLPHEPPARTPPLDPVAETRTEPPPPSPERDRVNARWDVGAAMREPPQGVGRAFAFLRRPLQRLVRFALGPVIERQVEMNSAQVQFDNELVSYLDARIDRVSRHYDEVLGLHGRRMEEIDERHLILQQELIRHVHDLVERIEFVFESAEQNHLYLEGMLRETKEELSRLLERWEQLTPRPPERPESPENPKIKD